MLAVRHEWLLWPQHSYGWAFTTAIKGPATWSCCGAQGKMAVMTAPSAAVQLGTSLPAIPCTTHTSGSHCPNPWKGRGEERGSSGTTSSVKHVAESGATWSHLQESLCLLMSPVYPPAVLITAQYQDDNSNGMNKTAGIQYQFEKKIQRTIRGWSLIAPALWNHNTLLTTSLIQRWEVKGRDDSFLLCRVVVVLWRQSCQRVVNLWQQGRLFVWIWFRLTSQACGLSLGVDVFLNGGSCIDKAMWPGQKGVNQEVTLSVWGF